MMSILMRLMLTSSLLISLPVWAGEFANNCTNGLSKGVFHATQCDIHEEFQGKTYCFSSEGARDSFLFDPQGMIDKATIFYAKNADSNAMSMPDKMKDKMELTADKDTEVERTKITQADALKQINSKTCDLSNRDAGYLAFDGMDLRHCNMVNTSFFGAYLRGANLSGAEMQKSYLNLARLENANLSGANLTDATIFQAIFDQTNFQGANLTNARMIGTLGNVDMSGANITKGRFGLDIGNQPMGAMRFDAIGGNFANSNFEGADINRSNFRFANLRGANLRHADLFRADLSKADLTDADITGANLGEAILDDTNLANVKGLESIKGYDVAKGKCLNCAAILAIPKSELSTSTTKTTQLNLMTAENPAKSFCRMGARF
jgi:uncharacterized protein YjbI with pentapeptide repeats/YHS domain-containing protein